MMAQTYRDNNFNVTNIDKCISYVNNLNIKDKNLTFLGKGGQGTAYLLNTLLCGKIVIKISKNIPDTEKEILALKMCKQYIDNDITPNFLYYYDTINKNNMSYILTEYADGTLEDWIRVVHSDSEWRSFMFQFLHGVYIIQTLLKAYHSDLKPKNIFYKKLKSKDSVFKYIIANDTYYVPTHGYLFMLADFGHIQSMLVGKPKISNSTIQTHIDNNIDLEHIIELPKRILVSSLEKMYTKDQMINIIKDNKDEYFNNYLQSKTAQINKDLNKYPQFIKNKMILKSIAYYIIEKKYINNIPIDKQVKKLPSNKIINDISNIFAEKTSIINMFKMFDDYKTAVSTVKTFSIKN
jgi:hypothetical protein